MFNGRLKIFDSLQLANMTISIDVSKEWSLDLKGLKLSLEGFQELRRGIGGEGETNEGRGRGRVGNLEVN